MKKSRFTEEQIIGFLRRAEAGIPIKEVCRNGGFSDVTFYRWRSKFGGMEASEAQRLRELETENAKLKMQLAYRPSFMRPRGGGWRCPTAARLTACLMSPSRPGAGALWRSMRRCVPRPPSPSKPRGGGYRDSHPRGPRRARPCSGLPGCVFEVGLALFQHRLLGPCRRPRCWWARTRAT